MLTQTEKGKIFHSLHERDDAFIIPNPWDVGSARLLEGLGFEALASSSAGYAISVGQRDNTINRQEMLVHLSEIAAATNIPVSADLGNGFGDAPEVVAETIRLTAVAGVVGGSIEDSTGISDSPIYQQELAVERIRAAAAAVKNLSFPFTLTARAENYLHGRPDLKDTIKRLQAYQEAGADVLYAPGMTSKDDIATLVSSVDRPVNVIVGFQGIRLSRAELSAIGVRRISLGSALARSAFGAFLRAAREMNEHGTFTFAEEAVSYRDISALLAD
jgi:2-methylisocitrate lyase-like PEP mutase family enzyme